MDTPKNYCTHAIETIRRLVALVESNPRAGLTPEVELFYLALLQGSVKFLLPPNGIVLDDDDYSPNKFDLLRLPYPVCALEFEAGDERFEASSGLQRSNRRIALAFDPHALSAEAMALFVRSTGRPDLYQYLPERALCIGAVYDTAGELEWCYSAGVVCLDLDRDTPRKQGTYEEETLLQAIVDPEKKKKRTKHALPLACYPFFTRLSVSGTETIPEMERIVFIDTLDEVSVSYNFLAAINCANVHTVALSPSAKLNAKRVKSGKDPLFEYRVLNLNLTNPTDSASSSRGAGTHASPTTHLRRGHIRRLENKTIWINAVLVNAGKEGFIDKAYQIK